MKYRSNIPHYAQFVFESVDPAFPERAKAYKEKGESGFIIAGNSYGQGSSREHAAICPMYLGIRAVCAVSIERIHQANLCNFGILPLLFGNEEDYGKIEEGDELELLSPLSSLSSGSFTLRDLTKNLDIPMRLFASEEQKEMLRVGGRLNEEKA